MKPLRHFLTYGSPRRNDGGGWACLQLILFLAFKCLTEDAYYYQPCRACACRQLIIIINISWSSISGHKELRPINRWADIRKWQTCTLRLQTTWSTWTLSASWVPNRFRYPTRRIPIQRNGTIISIVRQNCIQETMGFLSETHKTENAFESFYGTNLAGREVATSEMSEEEVCLCINMCLQGLPSRLFGTWWLSTMHFPSVFQMSSKNAYRYIKDEREWYTSIMLPLPA